MEYYAEKFTEKYPFRYVVKSPSYFIYTTNKRHFIKLLGRIKRGKVTEFTPPNIQKLSMSSFTCNKTQ